MNTDLVKISWNALPDEVRELQLELLPSPLLAQGVLFPLHVCQGEDASYGFMESLE